MKEFDFVLARYVTTCKNLARCQTYLLTPGLQNTPLGENTELLFILKQFTGTVTIISNVKISLQKLLQFRHFTVINHKIVFFNLSANKEEETVYSEVKERSKTTENTADTNGLLPDQKTNSRGRCYQQVACCLGILCVIFLLGIIAVCVYMQHLNKLSEDENLRKHNNLSVQFHNLTQDYFVLESKIVNLTAENQNLNLQNQDLKSQRNNLTELIRNMERKWTEHNVSRAQWSIDAYCPKPQNQNRTCKACQNGWLLSQSSCYAINNPDGSDQKTWEEAQENCRGKISDLVVIGDQKEKTFISKNSWGGSGTRGYWIGLRAEDEEWKWVDGSNLTDNSWIQEPATKGQCVISLENEGWKSVSCGDRNRWICKQKALSV